MAKTATIAGIIALIEFIVPGAAAGATVGGQGVAEFHFPVRISKTETTQGTLRLPRGYRPGDKVPALLVFGGFESASRVLDLIRGDRQVALASFDYPFSAPRRFQFPESLTAISQAKALFSKTEYGIADLVKLLRKRPEIDATRFVLVGASFGAPFVIAAAAQDPGISGLVLVHGFGQVPDTLDHVIRRSWIPKYGWIARPLAWLVAHLGWYYLDLPTPESLVRTLQPAQSVLMVTAEQDSFIPRQSSDELWQAIENSKAHSTRLLMPTDHLMPGADAVIDQIIEKVVQWMQGRDLMRRTSGEALKKGSFQN